MAALAVLGSLTGCAGREEVTDGVQDQRTESTAPVRASPAPSRPRAPSAPPTSAQVVQPVRLQLPAVGIDIPVVAVGVAADGQMELPPDPATIGWYRFGPSTSDARGSVVLGGHLDSRQYGVGPLVRLRTLRAGDLVVIRSTDGSVTTYKVRTVEDIAKSRLALDQVFDRDGARLLRIITCGGPYDRDGGGYRDNLVVTAAPAQVRR